ncbi:E3 ubiquitin-protein ligase SHPRH isoform X2 [Periplaneta americana]|uniref:E3 ubiquitin-protein ligase SHPRH isoform X2 n=1 Tax=Periplaneta americana TaxID=6978 RepID=UPI0037E8843C
MVKRKSVLPQRLCDDRRSELTWDLANKDDPLLGEVSNIDVSHCSGLLFQENDHITKNKTNNKRPRSKSQREEEVTDKYLKDLLADCAFYLKLEKSLKLDKSERTFHLGTISLTIKTNSKIFPKDGEYWLYVSEFPDRSLLYSECCNDVAYFLIDGTLDFQFYSGLSLRCFVLTFEGFSEDTNNLKINVLFRETYCRGPLAHWEIKQRSTNNDFQAVMSHFYDIATPAYAGIGEVRKHDVEALYRVVKECHEDAQSDKLQFTQHASLVPKLRPYQTRAVKWMLCRESATDDFGDELHCLYTEFITLDGQVLYYNKYAGYITLEKPKAVKLPSGGILADEMGLGKTVEILACLLANQRPVTVSNTEDISDSKNVSLLFGDEINYENKVENVCGQTEDLVNARKEETDVQRSSLCSGYVSGIEPSTSSSTDKTYTSIIEKGPDDSSNFQWINVGMECDVAANVLISTCNESLSGDSNSCSDVRVLENHILPSSKTSTVKKESERSSGIDMENNNSNTCEMPVSEECTKKYQNGKSDCNLNDFICTYATTSNTINDTEHFYIDSDDDDYDCDDDDDEDWESSVRYKRLRVGRQKKKSKMRAVRKMKDRCTNVIARKSSISNYKDKKARKIQRRKSKMFTDPVEETIEEVISKFCYGKGAVKNKRGRLRAVSSWREASHIWYREMLSVVKLHKPQRIQELATGTILECVCGSDEDCDKSKVCCSGCGRWQHAQCVGFKQHEGEHNSNTYCCPQCWQGQEPIVSGATLIVSPASISNQWVTEIQRHVSQENFSILVYRGVHKDGFLQPHDIAKYHIVITTYETLRKELDYADLNTTNGHKLRHVKRFLAPPSPLPCVQWWRLCLDEAQMVECTGSKTAEMARRLGAVHRWAITGTPVQKSMHDLFGLVQFLGIDPYSDLRWWQDLVYGPYCHGDHASMHKLMSEIMWRTAKKDVLHQINIPEQNEEVEWLHFSPVEEHFYRRQHTECSQDFIEKLSKIRSLDITLDSLDRQTINKILGPLLRLRQACSHPQAVRGQFLTATKATMSMEELLESLIKKTQSESEEALRLYIAALNGLAGIHIIRENWTKAVETYRSVLRIAEEYKDKLKTDKLQMIHTLHNLADMLDGHHEGISPTLRDDKLREEARALEQKYMHKCDIQVATAQETLAGLSAAVAELENGFNMGRDDWWEQLLSWLVLQGEEMELLSRIRDDLLENRVPGQESLINRVSSIRGVEYEIGKWSDAVQKTRKKAVQDLRQLEKTPRQDLVNGAVDCHLRLSNANNKNKKMCRLCICECLLKNYESLVFAVSKKQTEHSMVGNVLLLGQLNQGTWKPCEMERVLKVIVAHVRGRRSNRECLEDGNQYLKLLEAIKREFRHLRLVWTQLRDQVSAQDELDMAKMRLRIRFPDEPVPQSNKKRNPLQQLSSNIGNAVETIHIIENHQVSSYEARLEMERIVAQGDLRRKTGQLLYLENLRKSRGLDSNPDPCPVCQTNLGDKWSVLQCGHCYCMECVRYMVDQSRGVRKVSVKCPICRETTQEDGISYVNLSCKVYETKDDETPITVRGSHSTKVEAVVHCLLSLRAAEPDVKALVFSTWEKVLDVLAHALTENNISFSRLQPGLKHQEILQNFKDSKPNVTALLLPVRWGAKGLNLIEATHVLLVEPILNPADELQAIGRVHRIGQTRKTVVHRFLIRGTVEERIHAAVRSGAENWSGDKITLRQLQDLFAAPCEDSNNVSNDKSAIHNTNSPTNVCTASTSSCGNSSNSLNEDIPDNNATAKSHETIVDVNILPHSTNVTVFNETLPNNASEEIVIVGEATAT